jgi:mRNA interferase HigB
LAGEAKAISQAARGDRTAQTSTASRLGVRGHFYLYYVFDIGGNKYRVITAIHFDQQKLFVRHVFTHKEYDKWKP